MELMPKALLHIVDDSHDIMAKNQAARTERRSHSKTYDSNVRWSSIGRQYEASNSTCNLGTILNMINWTTKK